MQGVRLQSGRTLVFFKKMFPIFMCLGKLRVECKGCHGNTSFFLQTGHKRPTHILEATANHFHAGSCLGYLSASRVMGDSSLEAKGIRVCIPCITSKIPPLSSLCDLGGHPFLQKE